MTEWLFFLCFFFILDHSVIAPLPPPPPFPPFPDSSVLICFCLRHFGVFSAFGFWLRSSSSSASSSSRHCWKCIRISPTPSPHWLPFRPSPRCSANHSSSSPKIFDSTDERRIQTIDEIKTKTRAKRKKRAFVFF